MSDVKLEDAYESYKRVKEGNWKCDVQVPPEPEPDMCLDEPDMIAMESSKDA